MSGFSTNEPNRIPPVNTPTNQPAQTQQTHPGGANPLESAQDIIQNAGSGTNTDDEPGGENNNQLSIKRRSR